MTRSEGNQAKDASICNLHEGALALLDPKHGGTGIGIADAAIADSLRRKLERTIPGISPQTRVALFEAAWKFSRLPELCDIVVMLLETWPGRLPHEVAGAVHKFPEKAFAQMPKFVKWKCCAVVPARFRLMLVSLVERWHLKISPCVQKTLSQVVVGVSSRSTARRAADPSLYSALWGLVGHDILLLDSFSHLIWRIVRREMKFDHSCLFLVLYVDVVLGLKSKSDNDVRRIATIFDSVAMHGTWDNATLSRFMAILKGIMARVANDTKQSSFRSCAASSFKQVTLRASLKRCLNSLQAADSSNLFASPVKDHMAPGYSSIVREPIDFCMMRSKIFRVKNPYDSLEAFERDVKLMVDNCTLYHGVGSKHACEAKVLWEAWLQSKIAETIPCGREPASVGSSCKLETCRRKDTHSTLAPMISHVTFLPMMLMLCEPIAAAVAYRDLNGEVKTCLKQHLLPGQKNGLVNLHRLLCVHEASQNALRLHIIYPHNLTSLSHIDTPKLLEQEWHRQRD